jgi:hypothetical protein
LGRCTRGERDSQAHRHALPAENSGRLVFSGSQRLFADSPFVSAECPSTDAPRVGNQ